jgi:hypothetical protein
MRAEIFTAGIWLIFRGLKFPPNNKIGENSHLWIKKMKKNLANHYVRMIYVKFKSGI